MLVTEGSDRVAAVQEPCMTSYLYSTGRYFDLPSERYLERIKLQYQLTFA